LSVDVVKVIDIVQAYNEFSGEKYEFVGTDYDKTKYALMMQKLSERLCERTDELKSQIDFTFIDNTSSFYIYSVNAQRSFNSSLLALNNSNYYAMGSFCYNSNLNYRFIFEMQKNLSFDEVQVNRDELKKELNMNYVEFNSQEFKDNILTRNDLYAYLIIMDRIEEAKDFLKDDEIIESNENIVIDIIIDGNTNETNINNSTSFNETELDIVDLVDEDVRESERVSGDVREFSYAKERFYTVTLWEDFISHDGSKISFTDSQATETCIKINNEILIKNELLKNYGLNFFQDMVDEQKKYQAIGNKYVCIYNGLELNGR